MSQKILIVDSNEDSKFLYESQLKGKYDLEFAFDGESALEKFKSDSEIELVITEIGLRKMDGISLIKEISSIATFQKIIVISFYGDIQNIRYAMNAGAYDFIIKPIDFDDLIKTLDRTIIVINENKQNIKNGQRLNLISEELNSTAKLQRSILPGNYFSKGNIDIYANTVPANEVGGDFYDFFEIDDDKVGIVMADVSGKNVSASIFMTMSKTLIKSFSKYFHDPVDCIKKVNDSLCLDNKMSMFVTAIYGIFSFKENSFVYVNAGHLAPRVIVKNIDIPLIAKSTTDIALGVVQDFPFSVNKFSFKDETFMLLYTDGVVEAINSKNEEYDYERLDDFLTKNKFNSAEKMFNGILDDIKNFVNGAKQFDDITMLCLHVSL